MSKFSDLVNSMGVPLLMDQLGDVDSVVYTPAGGVPVTLTAIIGPEETEQGQDEGGRCERVTREVVITTDPDSEYGGVAEPATNATATAKDATWAVEEILSKTDSLARLQLLRKGITERSRPGYRT